MPENHAVLAMFGLRGQKALVTGGSVGIGRACATALAIAGADVAIVGRKSEPGEKTCESLRAYGVSSFFVACDVSVSAQTDRMIAEVVDRFGRLDVAINSAGESACSSALHMKEEEWERTLGLNMTGLFWCAQREARQMLRQMPRGGKIINVGSIYATIAGGNCAYNASKAGVAHLTRSLAAEWGSEGINVNCISPSWTLTPANRDIPAEMRRRMRELTPKGRLCCHEDIYGPVIFLASSASDFVTGQEVVVDGGHTVNSWLTPPSRSTPIVVDPNLEERELRVDLERLG